MSQAPIIVVIKNEVRNILPPPQVTVVIKNEPKNILPQGPITVVLQTLKLTIQGNIPMNFVPFSFNCTVQGQTMFGPLPLIPQSIWLYITGSAQNQADGDFEIDGLNIITSQGCNLGDTIYGVIQL